MCVSGLCTPCPITTVHQTNGTVLSFTGQQVAPSQHLKTISYLKDIPDLCDLPEQFVMWLQRCTRNKLYAHFLPENPEESTPVPSNL